MNSLAWLYVFLAVQWVWIGCGLVFFALTPLCIHFLYGSRACIMSVFVCVPAVVFFLYRVGFLWR